MGFLVNSETRHTEVFDWAFLLTVKRLGFLVNSETRHTLITCSSKHLHVDSQNEMDLKFVEHTCGTLQGGWRKKCEFCVNSQMGGAAPELPEQDARGRTLREVV